MAKRRIKNDATRLGMEALEFITRMQKLHDLGVGQPGEVADHYLQYARLLRKAADVAETNAGFYDRLVQGRKAANR